MPRLERPSLSLIPSFVDNLREQIKAGKPIKTEEEIAEIENDPESALDHYLNPPLKEGHVPQIDLWYVEGNKFIGRLSIRTKLNEDLTLFGGNIGYSVTVTEQNKGHGANMLREALEYCRDNLSFDRVLITCDETNVPSAKVIEKNGGILEDRVPHPHEDRLTRRYWITL